MRHLQSILFLSLCMLLLSGCEKLSNQQEGYEVEYLSFYNDSCEMWGLMDTNGKVLVEPRFENTPSNVVNGRFSVNVDGLFYLYTAEEKPCKLGTFTDLGSFTGDLCPAVARGDNEIIYIDKEGREVLRPGKIDGKDITTAYNFFCGRSMIRLDDYKYGFLDEKGKNVIPCRYVDAWNFHDDVAIVYLDEAINIEEDTENSKGKWGVIDLDGNLLFTKTYGEMTPANYRFDEGLTIAQTTDGKLAILNKTGETVNIIDAEDSQGNIYNGRFAFRQNGKMGLMGTDGQVLIRAMYESLEYNGKLIIASKDDEQFFLLTPDGEKKGTLPKGWASLLESDFNNHGNCIIVRVDDEKVILADGNGKELNSGISTSTISTSFWYAVIKPSEEEEYTDDQEWLDDEEYIEEVEEDDDELEEAIDELEEYLDEDE